MQAGQTTLAEMHDSAVEHYGDGRRAHQSTCAGSGIFAPNLSATHLFTQGTKGPARRTGRKGARIFQQIVALEASTPLPPWITPTQWPSDWAFKDSPRCEASSSRGLNPAMLVGETDRPTCPLLSNTSLVVNTRSFGRRSSRRWILPRSRCVDTEGTGASLTNERADGRSEAVDSDLSQSR